MHDRGDKSLGIGNQLLALFQCAARRLDPGPINTFLGWIDCGRHVKKGEKAITLCIPVTVKRSPFWRSLQARRTPFQKNSAHKWN